MHRMPLSPRTSFQPFDVSTGEPNLYCPESLTDRRYLSWLERDQREFHLQTMIAVHLPRLTLMACGAAALLFGIVALEKTTLAISRDIPSMVRTAERVAP